MEALTSCHICGGVLRGVPTAHKLFQVTSDCRPWTERVDWAVCGKCGTVQKPVTDEWLAQADSIYAGYEIYAQGNGAEQSTFNAESGAGESRSRRIVEWLGRTRDLPESGYLLDIGCGNGALLRAFHDVRRSWALTGAELNDRNRAAVESVPNTRFYSGDIFAEKGSYNYIALIHTLEHIANPVDFLNRARDLLVPDGKLLIQVPHLTNSPFDLLIADHCTHFTGQTLVSVVEAAGYEIADLAVDMIPKELTLLARPGRCVDFDETCPDVEEGLEIVCEHASWLEALRNQGAGLSGNIGIFGSSISATWLASEIGGAVRFFVDEDVNRIGSHHMGLPIVSVGEIPNDCLVLMPLRPDIAKAVAGRLGEEGRRFVLPPEPGVTVA